MSFRSTKAGYRLVLIGLPSMTTTFQQNFQNQVVIMDSSQLKKYFHCASIFVFSSKSRGILICESKNIDYGSISAVTQEFASANTQHKISALFLSLSSCMTHTHGPAENFCIQRNSPSRPEEKLNLFVGLSLLARSSLFSPSPPNIALN